MDDYTSKDANSGGDPFSRFWVDLISKMSTAGFGAAAPAPPPHEDTFRRMRQAYFDAWAKHCDEVLHSPAFLDMMKKSLDNALAFKQELNEYLTKALHENQMPARSDTDSILLVLRSLEDRVLDRLDRLTGRVENLEEAVGGAAVEKPEGPSRAAKRPMKGNSK
jgi:hypothetical protein